MDPNRKFRKYVFEVEIVILFIYFFGIFEIICLLKMKNQLI